METHIWTIDDTDLTQVKNNEEPGVVRVKTISFVICSIINMVSIYSDMRPKVSGFGKLNQYRDSIATRAHLNLVRNALDSIISDSIINILDTGIEDNMPITINELLEVYTSANDKIFDKFYKRKVIKYKNDERLHVYDLLKCFTLIGAMCVTLGVYDSNPEFVSDVKSNLMYNDKVIIDKEYFMNIYDLVNKVIEKVELRKLDYGMHISNDTLNSRTIGTLVAEDEQGAITLNEAQKAIMILVRRCIILSDIL
jgi:hypothetical protein